MNILFPLNIYVFSLIYKQAKYIRVKKSFPNNTLHLVVKSAAKRYVGVHSFHFCTSSKLVLSPNMFF